EHAVAVEVTGRHGGRLGGDGEAARGPERAVAMPQENTHRAVAAVGHDQIEPAVAIDISHRYRGGLNARARVPRRLKCPVAVPHQHTHAAERRASVVIANGGRAAHSEVELAVAVEVPHGHGTGTVVDGVVDRAAETSCAVAQQHADTAASEGTLAKEITGN